MSQIGILIINKINHSKTCNSHANLIGNQNANFIRAKEFIQNISEKRTNYAACGNSNHGSALRRTFPRMLVTKLIIIEANIADQKLSIVNLSLQRAVSCNIAALIITKNNPNERKVIGSVTNLINPPKSALIRPNNRATQR